MDQVHHGVTSYVPRQIWAVTTSTSKTLPHSCTPTILSSGGEINIGQGTIITLTQHAGFQPVCPGTPVPQPVDPTQPGVNLDEVFGTLEPFYASTNSQVYAIAAATAVSYMLVIMLFITPRTFFVGGLGGEARGAGFLGSRGVMGGSYGNSPVTGVGGRPWLQKAAAFTVAVGFTLVTADTFRWAERQYKGRYDDPVEFSNKVMDGLEIRIVRVISETFLWLAQAQTLIRLFGRHKEKLVIKWTAFSLITLELIFSILNSFVDQDGHAHGRRFGNAIPAMDYLFALTLNLCYAAFVFYYALSKRRFAFYHVNMKNIPLVALLALISVLVPVIFFILDLSKPEFSAWGGYVRWVGAAAASVVVWEWVERIEALERDEKKDGILGREVFDGDEMLEANPTSEFSWPSSGRRNESGSGNEGGFGNSITNGWNDIASRTRNLRRVARKAQRPRRQAASTAVQRRSTGAPAHSRRQEGVLQTPDVPISIASPVSRTDTTSAASTVYRVHYHPISEQTPPVRETPPIRDDTGLQQTNPTIIDDRYQQPQQIEQQVQAISRHQPENPTIMDAKTSLPSKLLSNSMSRVMHPFKRARDSPPLEVAQVLSLNPPVSSSVPSRGHVAEHGLMKRLHLRRSQRTYLPPEGIVVVPAPQERRPQSGVADEYQEVNHDATEAENFATPGNSTSPHLRDDTESPPDAVLRALQNQSQNLSAVSTSLPPVLSSPRNLSAAVSGNSNNNWSMPWSRDTPMISEETDENATGPMSPYKPTAHDDRTRRSPPTAISTIPNISPINAAPDLGLNNGRVCRRSEEDLPD